MNEWQFYRQIKNLLGAATWTGGSKIWGSSIIVTARIPRDVLARFRLPAVLIAPGTGQHDAEHQEEPGLVRVTSTLTLVASAPGDAAGEHSLLGAGRVDELKSGGKGLLELQEELFRQVKLLTQENGVWILARAVSEVNAQADSDLGYIAWRDYVLEAELTVSKLFPPARSLQASGAGGGNASLTWKLPPSRFDLYRVRLRRVAGSTPPATITDGTEVVLSGNLVTSHSDGPGTGEWSYSLFAVYDDRTTPPDSDDHVSDPVSDTVTVV